MRQKLSALFILFSLNFVSLCASADFYSDCPTVTPQDKEVIAALLARARAFESGLNHFNIVNPRLPAINLSCNEVAVVARPRIGGLPHQPGLAAALVTNSGGSPLGPRALILATLDANDALNSQSIVVNYGILSEMPAGISLFLNAASARGSAFVLSIGDANGTFTDLSIAARENQVRLMGVTIQDTSADFSRCTEAGDRSPIVVDSGLQFTQIVPDGMHYIRRTANQGCGRVSSVP